MAEEPNPKTITMTETELAELTDKISGAAKADAEKAFNAAKEADKAEREKADAIEQGKWRELATKAEQERDAERAERRKLTFASALSAHLIDKHPDYVKSAKYILPLIPADTKDADLAKAVESAAADFVKDNPRQATRSFGVPSHAQPRLQGNDKNGSRPSLSADPVGHILSAYPGPRIPNRNN